MIPVEEAIRIVKRRTRTLGNETVRLADAVGRILAQNIKADSDMPPFNRSQMDGYAMRAKDSLAAPVDLTLVGESAAGRGWHEKLVKGATIRIMTGAPVPVGADAVQKLELTSEAGDTVTISEPTAKGRYIVKKGSEIKKGALLFRRGDIINEKMVASLAAFGYSAVEVSELPTVSILATGSEIVPVDRVPGLDQIRNSNSVMLRSLCEQAGAKTVVLRQTGDVLKKLKAVISKSVDLSKRSKIANRRSQILVITGGVSVGKYDLTKAALLDLGAKIYFDRVRLKPGKPTVFAQLGETLVFGLPGNPISAAVTFYLFVRTAIMTMQRAASAELPGGHGILTSPAKAAKERDTYLPATITTDRSGKLLVSPLRWLGSSDFVGFAQADALIFVPKGETLSAGKVARVSFL